MGQVLWNAVDGQFAGHPGDDGAVIPAQPAGHPRCERGDLGGEPVDLGPDSQRLRAVVEQPARRPIEQPALIEGHPVGHGHRYSVIEPRRADTPPGVLDTEDGVGRDERPHRVDVPHAGILGDPEGVGDTSGVDHVVDQHGGHDLAAQLVAADVPGEPVAQLRREVPRQPRREGVLVGQVAVQHLFFERQLHVRHQRRQLR